MPHLNVFRVISESASGGRYKFFTDHFPLLCSSILWMLIAAEESGGLPSAMYLLPALFIEQRPSLWYCLVSQKLFIPKHPNRLTSSLLVSEPELLLHGDAKNTANPDSDHTLPPVCGTTDPCVSALWGKKKKSTFTSYSLFTALLFLFPLRFDLVTRLGSRNWDHSSPSSLTLPRRNWTEYPPSRILKSTSFI